MIPGLNAGSYISLPDNGYGAQGNSADFLIGFYDVTPSFKTTGNGTTAPGSVAVNTFTSFSDPNGLLDSNFIAEGPVYTRTNYYPTGKQIAVDPSIISGKLLTGADFDVESITRMNDGSFWVGEEFGPYLLHFNPQGQLIDSPVRHPILRAPQNPQNTTGNPSNLPSSRGFEAMTRNADGSKLIVTTEASINSEADKRKLIVYEFDTATKQYTSNTWTYVKDSSDPITGGTGNSTNTFLTGDVANIGGNKFVMIERDDGQGPVSPSNPNLPARQKKLYLFDLDAPLNPDGTLQKRLLVDLLNINDPNDIGGPLAGLPANTFDFPLQSVESLTMVDQFTLLVGLDNNYPGGNGRNPGAPDDTEIITLRFDVPLASLEVPEPTSLSLLSLSFLVTRRRK
jgi:hypothetical protein